jgi:hypothetical protein
MRRTTTIAAAGAALALLGAGCDNDDDPDPSADFLQQADRICLKSGIQPQAIPNDLPHAAAQLAEEAELRDGVREKLSALKPPEELRGDYARFLEQTGEVAARLARMAKLARGGREADLGELGRRTAELEAARFELAEKIGFRRCGRPITKPPVGT